MILKEVTIHKYKSIVQDQKIQMEKGITILVGMNEAGKTAVLESIAKVNYFMKDKAFEFDKSHDYPRLEKKESDKKKDIPNAVTCVFELNEEEIESIESDVGKGVFKLTEISISKNYQNSIIYNNLECNYLAFLKNLKLQKKQLEEFKNFGKESEMQFKEYLDRNEESREALGKIKKYFENKLQWDNPIKEYIARKHLSIKFPKFLYYDEYYALPSRISLEKLSEEKLGDEDQKTAKALIELADINIEELMKAENFENFQAELEATEGIISKELFRFWKSNQNIQIEFKIDKKENYLNSFANRIVEHILDIRVKNNKTNVSLPLKNRSKGFNWFFSFLVWFQKIQEDKKSKYIILLDEPGLNLHASAQSDLLEFIEELSDRYQIAYTTHSPFMIPHDKLHRVRTVYETNSSGTVISESIQERDQKTLFPLQAALGYDIAQNLFISKKNLLVEGVSDLIYLQAVSSLLEQIGRVSLNSEITIVPVGGLEKVVTFISLLRANKLDIVCLLDTVKDQKSKFNLDKMIKEKIIHQKRIRFYHEFINEFESADIEDLFTKEEYLRLFNDSFPEEPEIKLEELIQNQGILQQINKKIGKTFNHYRPANQLAKKGLDKESLSQYTLDRFEKMFIELNNLFSVGRNNA